MGCCSWRSHQILTWTPYLLCVLGKMKNEIHGFHYFWFCVILLDDNAMLLWLSDDFFFKINCLKNSFRNTLRVSNGLDLKFC